MNNREMNHDKLYAALKLIEELHNRGDIPTHVFKNILYKHRNEIDVTDFKCYNV